MVTVVFLTGEKQWSRWCFSWGEKRVVQQDRGQSHVANMCVGDAIKIPAVVKERGGITHREAKNPTTGTRRCGGNAGLGAPVLKTGMVFSSRNGVCHSTRCHGQHTKCVTGDTVVPSVIKEVNKTGYQCGG